MLRTRSGRALVGGFAASVAALAFSGGAALAASPHWSLVSSPNTSSSQSNGLSAVSCVSSSSCMAVGDYYNGANFQTLIARRNGSSWNLVSSPNTSSTPGQLPPQR